MSKIFKTNKYNILFNIKDKVNIIELNLTGKVIGIYINLSGDVSYKVRYFHNEEPKEVYFEDYEIAIFNPVDKPVGFAQIKNEDKK